MRTSVAKVDIAIDLNDLDNELLKQVTAFESACNAVAVSQSVYDEARDALKVLEAKLYLSTRARLDAEKEKYTETVLSNIVTTSKKRIVAVDAMRNAKLALDNALAAKEAWAQRAYIMRDLRELYIRQYYAETSITAEQQQQRHNANRAKIKKVRDGNA